MHPLTDKLWAAVEPHIPQTPASRKGGRPRISDRATFTGILFVLRYAIPWDELPLALGYGSGTTCWRRLVAWQCAGVWDRIWQAMLADLNRQERVKWERVALDGSSIPAKKGVEATGPNPTDRGKYVSKHHLVVDQQGIPLAATISAANVHDSRMMEATIDDIPAIRGRRGRPRRRPMKAHLDKGYDYERCRRALRLRNIIPRIARRGIESKERLGRHRWVVERTFSWLHAFRRLRIRYERLAMVHAALLALGCIVICSRFT